MWLRMHGSSLLSRCQQSPSHPPRSPSLHVSFCPTRYATSRSGYSASDWLIGFSAVYAHRPLSPYGHESYSRWPHTNLPGVSRSNLRGGACSGSVTSWIALYGEHLSSQSHSLGLQSHTPHVYTGRRASRYA